jgi:hypothetical protein
MVLGDVPRSERCRCNEPGAAKPNARKATSKGSKGLDAQPEGALAKFSAWLRK